ncbi:unnamed protein product, partial [marine sediment metagenome]
HYPVRLGSILFILDFIGLHIPEVVDVLPVPIFAKIGSTKFVLI